METELTIIKSPASGPVIFVVGGIHGDEPAGRQAVEQLAEQVELKAGTLYLLPQANAYGAQRDKRHTRDSRDLNRSFPGDPEGDGTQQLAFELYMLVEEVQPALVLDLHEAIPQDGGDFLGNSLVYSRLDGIEELVWSLLDHTLSAELCSTPFRYFDSAPAGSINRVVAEQLGIPVLTIETDRQEALDIRVQNHLEILEYVLSYYEMV